MRLLVFTLLLLSIFTSAQSSHIIGAEIGYRHLSGLQYEVYVNIYGDCDGNAFSNLNSPSAIAGVGIFNGNSIFTNVSCTPTGNFGLEITPVCDADSNNTTCRGGSIPGVAEFQFKTTVTLPTTSSNWRFVFSGDLGPQTGAGRSNLITNAQTLVNNNYSIMYLEATLNNTSGPNSTPELTTIPTPFFCVNQQNKYNVGAADIDGDQLNFSLVDALEPSTSGNPVSINYNPGFSGLQPLAASSFNMNTATGQLSFVPNQSQVALVVNRIEEYRNGVQVGSMMREMNFIVLNNCSNQSPSGKIVSNSIGILDSVTQTISKICYPDTAIDLVIDGGDADGNNVKMTVSGLSAAYYNITNNNTTNPQLAISYPIVFPTQGTQSVSFFVTYQDDACPLSSNQQIAYTINLENPITLGHTIISESCKPGGDGIINLNATTTNGGIVEYSINGGPYTTINTYTSLSAGNYHFTLKDSSGCIAKQSLQVDTSVDIHLINVMASDITCADRDDGIIEASNLPNSLSGVFSLLPINQTNGSGRFTNLAAGNYTLIVDGPGGCSDTASVSINSAPEFSFENIRIIDNRCDLNTGRIEIGSDVTIPVQYSISPNQQTNTTGAFGGLSTGQYIITVLDSNGCYKDTLVEVRNDPAELVASLSKKDISCKADGADGEASVFVAGGVEPYTFRWESIYGTEGTTAAILNQRSGIKRVFVTDAIGCATNEYIELNPANCCEKVFIPNAFTPNGDGHNENFKLRSPLTMTEFKFFVVNRWGQKVWEANNQLDVWDGNYPSGKLAGVGTYYYFLRYKCAGDEQTYTRKGDVSILR